MATDLSAVKLINGSLHESSLRGGTIILRGVLDSSTLKNLRFDDYQREALPAASLKDLIHALETGNPLPDIEIGMRGEKVGGKTAFYLNDPCYVIDGQQRVNACLQFLGSKPGTQVFLGAAIHFSTSYDWEAERFRILNSKRVKVSPNVLARNLRRRSVAINKLYELSHMSEDASCIAGRISWDQNMKRGKLITAMNFLKTTGRLHAHISSGHATQIEELSNQLDALCNKITPSLMRDNIKTFYEFMDEAWGIRAVQYRALSPHLTGGFMGLLATMFSNHHDFWKGPSEHRLFVDVELKRKIASFPLNDPGIAPLTSSQGASQNVLYDLLVRHVNSGKRTKRLRPRVEAQEVTSTEENE
jgi:hypothetical protein